MHFVNDMQSSQRGQPYLRTINTLYIEPCCATNGEFAKIPSIPPRERERGNNARKALSSKMSSSRTNELHFIRGSSHFLCQLVGLPFKIVSPFLEDWGLDQQSFLGRGSQANSQKIDITFFSVLLSYPSSIGKYSHQ